MDAVIINQYGSAEVLELQQIERPEPGPNQVQVMVQASSVNPIDWKLRNGMLKWFSGRRFPRQIGLDFAGTVTQAGTGVTNYQPGDEIFGMLPALNGGALAEYCVADQDFIFAKPANLNFREAAALPLAGLTALQGLRTIARIRPQADVFINGCTGGVGSMAVQIARFFNARVTGTCSSKNRQLAEDLGADEVLDYHDITLPPDDCKYDIIFDVASTMSYWVSTHHLPRGGTYLRTLPDWELYSIAPILSPLTAKFGRQIWVKPKASDLELLSEMADRNALFPHIEHVFDMQDIQAAHQLSESGHVRGKIAVTISEQTQEIKP